MTRLFVVLALLTSVGCGSSTPTGPTLTEEERKAQLKRDAELIQKERQESKSRPTPR